MKEHTLKTVVKVHKKCSDAAAVKLLLLRGLTGETLLILTLKSQLLFREMCSLKPRVVKILFCNNLLHFPKKSLLFLTSWPTSNKSRKQEILELCGA